MVETTDESTEDKTEEVPVEEEEDKIAVLDDTTYVSLMETEDLEGFEAYVESVDGKDMIFIKSQSSDGAGDTIEMHMWYDPSTAVVMKLRCL